MVCLLFVSLADAPRSSVTWYDKLLTLNDSALLPLKDIGNFFKSVNGKPLGVLSTKLFPFKFDENSLDSGVTFENSLVVHILFLQQIIQNQNHQCIRWIYMKVP